MSSNYVIGNILSNLLISSAKMSIESSFSSFNPIGVRIENKTRLYPSVDVAELNDKNRRSPQTSRQRLAERELLFHAKETKNRPKRNFTLLRNKI